MQWGLFKREVENQNKIGKFKVVWSGEWQKDQSGSREDYGRKNKRWDWGEDVESLSIDLNKL